MREVVAVPLKPTTDWRCELQPEWPGLEVQVERGWVLGCSRHFGPREAQVPGLWVSGGGWEHGQPEILP